ncbi:TPA: hypothetical protein PWY45_001087 [Mannheimia haemolytica]|uniref:Uncharacterized protein n=3 Tax=Mannheimia TaxID=75984 RepID=A0A378NHV2_MANHA|nr:MULTISPECIES: hypothetical protein [Mannheimia]AGQ38013.1 hypothetical protein J450_02285 [Mannheimia haemolytica D171]AJE08452.1 hypothetical protein B824_16570 [Mannheimia haemolytica USDA-ARS-USMARC-184]EEY08786.1 hypothetical protein COI_2639 [Mannheimia haemolytica serotype A2 str. OVINE]EEY12999.1 hypothetical protein COK_0910 [Mannheimia haemolytica serotype A2 str. BOVINE]EPY99488.1 hypothetical protein L278_09845 [Mannheimia haemolytica D35]
MTVKSTLESSFFKTKAGKMTLAFIVIMLAFALIMLGIYQVNNVFIHIGFVLMLVAMLYSPVDVFILNRKKN